VEQPGSRPAQTDQLRRIGPCECGIAGVPANIAAEISAFGPSQLVLRETPMQCWAAAACARMDFQIGPPRTSSGQGGAQAAPFDEGIECRHIKPHDSERTDMSSAHDTGSTTARSVDEVALIRDTISHYAPVLIAPLSNPTPLRTRSARRCNRT